MSRGRALGPGRLWKSANGNWTLDWRSADGKRRRKVLGMDKRVAERRRLALIAARDLELDGLGAVAGQDMQLGELRDIYLLDLAARVTPAHLKNVRQRLTWLVEELGSEMRVRELQPAHLVAVRSALQASGKANRTCNLAIDRLRAAFSWGIASGLVAVNPVTRLKRLPETRAHQVYKRRALTEPEIRIFIEAGAADDVQSASRWASGKVFHGGGRSRSGSVRIPQLPLWVTFLSTGARWNELRLAVWGDLDLTRGLLTLRAENTKSQRQRAIPLRAELIEHLQRLRVLQESLLGRLPNVSDRIFLSPSGSPWPKPTTNPMGIFDRLLVRAGIEKRDGNGYKLDLHALRHTLATRLARAGVGLSQAQRILGHSDPKLTAAVYTHLDAEDLRGAVDAMPTLGAGGTTGSKKAR